MLMMYVNNINLSNTYISIKLGHVLMSISQVMQQSLTNAFIADQQNQMQEIELMALLRTKF